MAFEQIEVGSKYYSIVKIVFLAAIFLVVAINVIASVYALPANTTNWSWGGIELRDDNLEEAEEEEDERQHALESERYDSSR